MMRAVRFVRVQLLDSVGMAAHVGDTADLGDDVELTDSELQTVVHDAKMAAWKAISRVRRAGKVKAGSRVRS